MKGMIHLLAIQIIQLIACLVLIGIVMLQSGKTAGLSGAIGGGSDTFLSKNKGKSLDAKLARATKWAAIVFVVLTLVLSML
jgi:preprotein translocase subunit SecG